MVIRFASNPQPVPPFLLQDLDGNVVSTAQWQGKVVILNFWATWCPPCREEIPILTELAKKYKDSLLIVGVSVDDGSPDDVREFAKAFHMNYPVVMWSHELVSEYGGVPALPTTFLINKDARIVQKHEGLYPPEVYDTEIRALMGLPVNVKIETFEDTGQIFLKNAVRATELPDVDFSGLSAEQKKIALKKLNSEGCNCGCRLTLGSMPNKRYILCSEPRPRGKSDSRYCECRTASTIADIAASTGHHQLISQTKIQIARRASISQPCERLRSIAFF